MPFLVAVILAIVTAWVKGPVPDHAVVSVADTCVDGTAAPTSVAVGVQVLGLLAALAAASAALALL